MKTTPPRLTGVIGGSNPKRYEERDKNEKNMGSRIFFISACLLAACVDNGAALAGTFVGVKKGNVWVFSYDKSRDEYNLKNYFYSDNNYDFSKDTNHLRRHGDWIENEENPYYIKVIDKNTLQYLDIPDNLYKRFEK
ncbi:hypothetical protein [Hafnia alvei]|uniref:hypothetical protein n=1 Tax=Hafnia alvei TaxID=569 RepID=UPI00345C88A8